GPAVPDDRRGGFQALQEILNHAPDTKVIVLTGQNDRANALQAIARGAYDFLAKPFDLEVLALTIERAFRLHELHEENKRLQSGRTAASLGGIITQDPEMMR